LEGFFVYLCFVQTTLKKLHFPFEIILKNSK
jgi:hypothetical protein